MSKAHPPELKKYMDKRLALKLNGGRHVSGILRGFDPFMNLVLDECTEETKGGEKHTIGMVEQTSQSYLCNEAKFKTKRNPCSIRTVIRGNSIVLLEALDRI